MSRSLFGTDGVRGVANRKLTPELAMSLGRAAGLYLKDRGLKPKAVMGRDTRQSGTMLGAALAAGLNSAGVEVHSVGVAPTGAVSWLARTKDYSLAAVISASHNPAPDNGIKLIDHTGAKVSDEAEEFIEAHLEAEFDRPVGGAVGEIVQSRDGLEDYMDWLESLVPERLEGMSVCVDGAHGAAHELGVEIFERLGAEVTSTGASPSGTNINEEGGATKPETIQSLTQSMKADFGVAYDGDADRAVFSDSHGRLINGDRTMAVWCSHWMKEGRLNPPVVVGTVMSNGGFEAHMKSLGIELARAKVGDKYVSQELVRLGGKIGGEQSGHIIFPFHGPTGDGLVTALELARVLQREGRSLAGFFEDFANHPQLLVNVQVERKDGWEENDDLCSAIREAREALAGTGRINVRASGTQPMIRVMVEARDEELRDREAARVVATMLSQLGGRIYSRVDLTYALGE